MPPPKVVQHTRVTCALDVAHTQPDGASAQTVGKLLGIVPRRVDQLEQRAMEKLRRAARMLR